MQPKIGTEGVHFPSTCSFCRLLTRSRWAGVNAARHRPSHSSVSAQIRAPSCVGTLQIGFGKSPAGPQRPPACSQRGCVCGISKRDPQIFRGGACCGCPTLIHLPSEQVQYPDAWATDGLAAQSNTAHAMQGTAANSHSFTNLTDYVFSFERLADGAAWPISLTKEAERLLIMRKIEGRSC